VEFSSADFILRGGRPQLTNETSPITLEVPNDVLTNDVGGVFKGFDRVAENFIDFAQWLVRTHRARLRFYAQSCEATRRSNSPIPIVNGC
jgi:hypothetical protein